MREEEVSMSQSPDLLDLSITLTPPPAGSPPEVLATLTLRCDQLGTRSALLVISRKCSVSPGSYYMTSTASWLCAPATLSRLYVACHRGKWPLSHPLSHHCASCW